MKILVIGDIVGKPGRQAIKQLVPKIKEELCIDFVIANGENIAGGTGVTQETLNDLYSSQVNVVTTGDHIWKKKETQKFINDYPNLLRPLNYPKGAPGKGAIVVEANRQGLKIGIVNILGRVFMPPMDCPFVAVDQVLETIKKETDIIIVDFHAEATSEKIAMGWFLDGKVSAVFGTHTHVATADERLLDKGTAFITDIGMTGPMDSVIGRKKEQIIQKYLTQRPLKFEIATDDVRLNGVIIEIDEKSGNALSIERLSRQL